MIWTEKYLKIPYVDRGESFNGCDCWGLLKLILKTELNIEISDHSDVSAGDVLAKARKMSKHAKADPEWIHIDKNQEKEFDTVLMRGQIRDNGSLRSVPIHIGCVVTSGKLIHLEKESGVLVVDYRRNPLIKNRVIGFYRHV